MFRSVGAVFGGSGGLSGDSIREYMGWQGRVSGMKKSKKTKKSKSSPKCMKRVEKVLEVSGSAFWASGRRVSVCRCAFRWVGWSLR